MVSSSLLILVGRTCVPRLSIRTGRIHSRFKQNTPQAKMLMRLSMRLSLPFMNFRKQ